MAQEDSDNVIGVAIINGNWFDAAAYCNAHDLADNVIGFSDSNPNYTRVILRLPKWEYDELKKDGVLT